MSNVVRLQDLQAIERQACDWVARLDSGNINADEALELRRWLAEDERHRRLLWEAAELLDRMSVVAVLNKLLPLSEVEMTVRQPRRIPWRLVGGVAMTACCVLVALWMAPAWITGPMNPTYGDYRTAIGEVNEFVLADDSRVTLNTNSHLSIAFDGVERRVMFHRGEALFDVARDAARPFVVEVAGNEVIAVGTKFNVDFATDEVEVTVVEGVIEVLSSHPSGAGAKHGDSLQKEASILLPRRVVAGESLTLDPSSVKHQRIDDAAVDRKLSWRRGELVFNGEPLEQVIAEISRYSVQNLVIVDDQIRGIAVGGVFEAGDFANLFDILEHGFGIRVTRADDGTVYLSARESTDT